MKLMFANEKRRIDPIKEMYRNMGLQDKDEEIVGVMEERSLDDTIGDLETILVVPVNSIIMYMAITEILDQDSGKEANVNTKYKIVDRKVKPVVAPLLKDSWERLQNVVKDPNLRDLRGIGHIFTKESREKLKVGGGDFLGQ
jgi:hypothetical protein